MGTIIHDVAVFVVYSDEALEQRVGDLRDSLPADFQPLVVGPVPSAINNTVTYAFLPDGSKEGWETSDLGDTYRKAFIDLFADRWRGDGVLVRFGPDLFDGEPYAIRPDDREGRT